MSYKQFYQETNEQARERFELVEERIAEIATAPGVKEPFADYFQKTAGFLGLLSETYRKVESGELMQADLQQQKQQ
ncbi:MAG: leucyl aminopeptidase, partial [Roseburia sp.]|nr:leucyl aminopeptidase [Roseburia sp.]